MKKEEGLQLKGFERAERVETKYLYVEVGKKGNGGGGVEQEVVKEKERKVSGDKKQR